MNLVSRRMIGGTWVVMGKEGKRMQMELAADEASSTFYIQTLFFRTMWPDWTLRSNWSPDLKVLPASMAGGMRIPSSV